MAQVFISYGSADEKNALRLYDFLKELGISAWFAPFHIAPGDDFAREIGKELGWKEDGEEDPLARSENLDGAKVVVLLLSKNSMKSTWVKREITFAVSCGKTIIPLRLDREVLTPEYRFLLVDLQIIDAYHLPRVALEKLKDELVKHVDFKESKLKEFVNKLSYRDIGIGSISIGDPYFVAGESFSVYLTDRVFYLAPPPNVSEANTEWAAEHFEKEDVLFGETLDEICAQIPIHDLRARIEASRNKVFRQFLNQENGCYFNNKKYGIFSVRPFGRTEDLSETPVLELHLYTTDYFTHRIMKDVCKAIIAEGNPFFEHVSYISLGAARIFFTSLGINLLLLDSSYRDGRNALLTVRSTNAAETYAREDYSVSVIEGVSLSDYDPYIKTVNIESAVLRGLQEELGIKSSAVDIGTLRFYELFVNFSNMEMGLACSIELSRNLSVRYNVLPLRGKDEKIEVAQKRPVPLDDLKTFALNNRKAFLPQAFYSILSYYESMGVSLINRDANCVMGEEYFTAGKGGENTPSGDAMFVGEHFFAVVDAATPKGERQWDGKPSDVYAAGLLCERMNELNPDCTGWEAINFLNGCLRDAYAVHGYDFSSLMPEERLQASVIIYSRARREVWNFGDCKLRVNSTEYDHTRPVDKLMSDLRAYCTEIGKAEGVTDGDYGRKCILPFLKQQALLSNGDSPFGYSVVDGGKIAEKDLIVYPLREGDHVVLASDGYPKLFDTLGETERYLHEALREDGACVGILRSTKGVTEGNESFDDRTYLSFVVK